MSIADIPRKGAAGAHGEAAQAQSHPRRGRARVRPLAWLLALGALGALLAWGRDVGHRHRTYGAEGASRAGVGGADLAAAAAVAHTFFMRRGAGERGAPRVAAQAATAPDNDDGRESEVPAPAPRGASSAGGAGEDEGEGAGETKEEPPPDGSLSPAPPPLTRIFVGMVTACCSPQHGRRRDIHRAIYADYLEGRVGERPPLPAGAQEARGKRAVDLRFVVGHPEGDPDFDTVEDASLRRELKEADDLVRFRMVDSYLGLYKKTELLLSWALLHTDAQYFAKVDDDVYLNYHALWTFVDSTWGPSPYGVYTGNFHRFEPIRKESSKWYISYDQWPAECPNTPYADGWAYIMSRDVVLGASAVLRSATELALSNATLPEGVQTWAVPELLTDPQLRGIPAVEGLHADTWDPALDKSRKRSITGGQCSLNRIWFEDVRVSIAVLSTHAGADWIISKWADPSKRYFASAWNCCYRDTVAKHLDFGCKTQPAAVLPKLHSVMNRSLARNDRVQCVHRDMGSCGRQAQHIGAWIDLMTGGEGFGATCGE